MKSIKLSEIIAVILILLGIAAFDSKRTEENRWDNDLNLLTEKLETYHPNPWENISREEYLQQINIIKENSDQWNNEKVILEIMKVIASIGDGHTELSLNNKDQFNLWFPVRIEKFYDGLFITGISDEFPNILKAKILKIEEKKADEVFSLIGEIVAVDDEKGLPRVITNYLSNAVILENLEIIKNRNTMSLEVMTSSGEIVHVELNSEPWYMAQNWAYYQMNVPTADNTLTIYDHVTDSLPLFLKNVITNRKAYWFAYKPEHKMLYFQFNDVHNSGNELFGEFTNRMFSVFDKEKNNIDQFIIDVRFNEGGDGSLLRPLVHQFIKRSENLERGKLFIITGTNTFSAASNFIGQMLKNTSVITVGDVAAGPLNWSSDIIKFELPDHNILVNISTMAWQEGHPTDKRGYYPPDVFVPTNAKDYFKLKDTPLETILNKKAVALKDVLVNNGIESFENTYNSLKIKYPDVYNWFPYTSFDLTLFAFQDLIPIGKIDEALAISKFNADIYPNNIRAWYITAMIHEAKGEFQEALNCLDKMAELEPDYVEAMWDRDKIKAMIEPIKVDREEQLLYKGVYGERTVLAENDTLWYKQEDSSKKQLLPLGNHVFFIEGTNSKIEFLVEGDKASSMRIFSYNGKGYKYERTN